MSDILFIWSGAPVRPCPSQCVTDLHDCLSFRREEQLGSEGAAGAHPHPQDVQDAVVVLDRAHHGRHEHRQRHGRALQPAAVAHRRPL